MSGECCSSNYMFWLKTVAIITIILSAYKKFLASKVAAFIINKFEPSLSEYAYPGKLKIFDEAFGKVKRAENGQFKVLEIGVGNGANFKLYPENCEITITDKSDDFLPYLKDKLNNIKRNDLKINNFVVKNAENMLDLESNSFDAVVATFTFCSICNEKAALNEINRVLKPGGVYLFMDHSRNFENKIYYWIQAVLEPIWSFFIDNCAFKDIKSILTSNTNFKWEISKYKEMKGAFSVIANPVLYGFGVKNN